MSRAVVLDAGTLGMLTHPRRKVNRPVADWCRRCLLTEVTLVVPEIADYEVRRELIRARKPKSVARLDALAKAILYLPITTPTMREAARLWADLRNQGLPTADDKALDADVILAAQARSPQDQYDEVVIATDNVGHLDRMAAAKRWSDL